MSIRDCIVRVGVRVRVGVGVSLVRSGVYRGVKDTQAAWGVSRDKGGESRLSDRGNWGGRVVVSCERRLTR